MNDVMPTPEAGAEVSTHSREVLYEFVGQLTKSELWRWIFWRLWRRSAWIYAAWLGFLGTISGVSVLSDAGKSAGRDKSIGYLLIIFHIYFVGYFFYKVTLGVRSVAKHEVVEGKDRTVRFYPNKVEFVSPEGVVNQFPGTLVRIRKTAFGIAAATPNGLPLFLLPSRVLSSEEIEALPNLYAGQKT